MPAHTRLAPSLSRRTTLAELTSSWPAVLKAAIIASLTRSPTCGGGTLWWQIVGAGSGDTEVREPKEKRAQQGNPLAALGWPGGGRSLDGHVLTQPN